MIHKSYLVEQNFDILKNNLVLFYGENVGLIDDFKDKIIKNFSRSNIIKFNQDEILKNKSLLLNELQNVSLFHQQKIFLIRDINDKAFNLIEEIVAEIGDNKIFLFSDILEKRSKLRTFFEKDRKIDIVPCYEDNNLTIKKIISYELKNITGVSHQVINLLNEVCGNDRSKLRNEINKIKTLFNEKPITFDELNKLLNLGENDDFKLLKNTAISGKKNEISKFLSRTVLEDNKLTYYIAAINQTLLRLKQIDQSTKESVEERINQLKPPLFWKDKSEFLEQVKLWNTKKINYVLDLTYNLEVVAKSNTQVDKSIIMKKLLVDICCLANAA